MAEGILHREIKRFGKQVFGKVIEEMETEKLEEAKGKVGRREKVPRYLFTSLGLIRFERHKVKYKETGKFSFLLDDVLKLRPYQAATGWVRQRALELAGQISLQLVDVHIVWYTKFEGFTYPHVGSPPSFVVVFSR